MSNVAGIVKSGDFECTRPDLIIECAYNKLKMLNNQRPIGSSTACVLTITKKRLYSANLGDSGYLICRGGKVIFRSPEQTHYLMLHINLQYFQNKCSTKRNHFYWTNQNVQN
uniref:Protein phosphatase n=1 Tax=Meloidogyne enterolobii TaxID=390850 RepID=A0A6V7X090_MELEN|nr:unnamed protein product [Meloidogyne enterolobii]